MSYPAAKALPLVGVFAEGESFLTSRGGDWEIVVTGSALADVGVGGAIVLGRLGNGDAGSEGGSWEGATVCGGVEGMVNIITITIEVG